MSSEVFNVKVLFLIYKKREENNFSCSNYEVFVMFMNVFNLVQELGAQNKEKMKLERSKENNNDLLKYLRSLHPEMVSLQR